MATPDAALRQIISAYPTDPVGYALDVLGASLTPDQVDLPSLLLNPPFRLLIPSANKVGKTFSLGWLVNWHYDSFDPGITLVTSATATSLKTQAFKEVRRQRNRIPRVARELLPRAPLIFGTDQHQVIGYSPKNPDAAQGHHAAHWLLFMDEATAVPVEIADRAETMFSGVPGHGWVCFYNPNDPTTWPYAAEQGGGWSVKRLSALDHPNLAAELRGLPIPYPDAVRLHRIEERIRKECEDCGSSPHDETCFQWPPPNLARAGERKPPFDKPRWWKPIKPEFDPQVRGKWPQQAMNSIWNEADKKRCSERRDVDRTWPVQIGLDCARFGTARWCFAVRKGVCLIHLEEHRHWPTRQVSRHAAERLRELCNQYAPEGTAPEDVVCCIDDSGGYGSGVTDHPEGYNFVGVSAATAASDPKQYPNKRAELWFMSRLAADQGGFCTGSCGPGAELVDSLWQEYTAVRYSLDGKGRRVVEGKDAVSARLRRSPDLADAVNLAWIPIG